MALFNEKQHSPSPSRWRRLLEKLVPASAAYRPERHYMRGPGPKYRERHPSYGTPAEPTSMRPLLPLRIENGVSSIAAATTRGVNS